MLINNISSAVLNPRHWRGISFKKLSSRPDVHWEPNIVYLGARISLENPPRPGKQPRTKGSRKWRRMIQGRRKIQALKARQQKQARRELAKQLLKLGPHFVVTDLTIRSKKEKLADSSKPERGGVLGPNWSAQNTGAISNLVAQLVHKATECGGTVRKHKFPGRPDSGSDKLDKVRAARLLRDSFLSSQAQTTE